MSQQILDSEDFEKEVDYLSKKYESQMDGYTIFSVHSIYVPFFKIKFKVSYITTTEMNILEEFLCYLVQAEVTQKKDILQVLQVDDSFLNMASESLIKNGVLAIEEDRYHFANGGEKLFEAKRKYENVTDYFDWTFDALSDDFQIDYFNSEEEHRLLLPSEVVTEKDKSLVFPTKYIPLYQEERDRKNVEKIIVEKIRKEHHPIAEKLSVPIDNQVNVENVVLLPEKKIYYHKYLLFAYTNGYGDCRLLAHDPCGLTIDVDTRVTELLETLMDRKDLSQEIQEVIDKVPSIAGVMEALKSSILAKDLTLPQDEQDKRSEVIDTIFNTPMNVRLLSTRHIREKFLQVMKEATKSLYIISPWMSKSVVDDNFKSDFRELLQRDVDIHILYGLDGDKPGDNLKNEKTEKHANELRRIGNYHKNNGLFSITKGKTHEKVLMWDDNHLIIGSYNFLSYSAEDFYDIRGELCIYLENPELINEIKDLRFSHIN